MADETPAEGQETDPVETPTEGETEVTDKRLNSFNASEAAEVAAKMVSEDAYLAALVSRDLEHDLLGGGGRGRTVNIRIPSALVARTRDIDETEEAIVLDRLSEDRVPLTLGTHIYSAVGLTEGEMNLDLKSFAEQVMAPQVDAVVEKIESTVAASLNDIEVDTDLSTLFDEDNPVAIFTALRKALRQRGIPQSGLNVVVGTEVYAKLLDASVLTDASTSGSTAALREGNVGKLRGFTIVESTRVPDDDIIAFHRDAFTLAVRAPMVPAGQFGGISAQNGFQLRYLRDYDTMHTLHRSMVSTFAGVATMPLYKVVRDETNHTATIEEVEGGAAIHVTTAGE